MGIDRAHYHGWRGELHSSWYGCLAIVRVALLQVFRRKSYWFVIALGLMNFLLFWSIIYAVTQFKLPPEAQRVMLGRFGFSAQPNAGMESGYIIFMQRQSLVVMILLAFSGSLLIGSDFRMGALPFYLSRRIDRRHYIVGKLLAISAVITILTTLPALLLYVEYGMFTSSLNYWSDNWRIVVSVLIYGASLAVVLSILLVTLSAYLQRVAPIAIVWSTLFVMLNWAASALRRATGNDYWKLLDPWRDIRYLGRLCFGTFEDQAEYRLAVAATIILAVVCTGALMLLVRRVRAVDVAE